MALNIHRLSEGDGGDMGKAVIAARRIYRTIDGRFVHEGDPEGAFLAYGQGAEIPPGDQAKYDALMSAGEPESLAARAQTDDDARDLLRRRQAGDPSVAARPNEPPILLHDRLATELADEAAAIANAPDQGAVAAERSDPDEPGGVLAEWRVFRTSEGDLVHEGDEDAATLAYAVGQPIADADVDEYKDMSAPDADAEPDGAKTPPAGAKRAAKATNKAAAKPADK